MQRGLLQIGIIILTLVTAVVHLVILNVRMARIDPPFILNGLGFLALLAALYLPLPIVKERRSLVRWIFIGFTAITILAWAAIGSRDALGYLTKLDEVALIILLWLEGRR
jgi:uncharacterized membrane protein YeiH